MLHEVLDQRRVRSYRHGASTRWDPRRLPKRLLYSGRDKTLIDFQRNANIALQVSV